MQMEAAWNLEKEHQVIEAGTGFDTYKTEVVDFGCEGRNCSQMYMTICTK